MSTSAAFGDIAQCIIFMSESMTSFCFYSSEDPIARVIQANPRKHVCVISMQEFIEEVQVFDVIDTEGAVVSWLFDGRTLSSQQQVLLLNRNHGIARGYFNRLSSVDDSYCISELYAYLGFALSVFEHLNKVVTPYGQDPFYDLPIQWSLMMSMGLAVPTYYWGDPRFNPLKGEDIIFSESHNIYKWRNKKNDTDDKDRVIDFCFRRPVGDPIFVLIVGQCGMAVCGRTRSIIRCTTVLEIAIQVAEKLDLFVGEAVFFRNNRSGEYVFGAMSSRINFTSTIDGFETVVLKGLSYAAFYK